MLIADFFRSLKAEFLGVSIDKQDPDNGTARNGNESDSLSPDHRRDQPDRTASPRHHS